MEGLITSWNLSGPEKDIWTTAASQFRLPYWDWARKQPYLGNFGIPQICTLDSIGIIMPGGATQPTANPLVGFTNPTLVGGKNAAMGDPIMGVNAIKADATLPVSISQRFDPKELTPSIGTSAWARAATVFSQTNHRRTGST